MKYLTQGLCTYSNVGADHPQPCAVTKRGSAFDRPGVIPHSLSSSGIKSIFTTIKLYLIQPSVYFQGTIGQQEIKIIMENINSLFKSTLVPVQKNAYIFSILLQEKATTRCTV